MADDCDRPTPTERLWSLLPYLLAPFLCLAVVLMWSEAMRGLGQALKR